MIKLWRSTTKEEQQQTAVLTQEQTRMLMDTIVPACARATQGVSLTGQTERHCCSCKGGLFCRLSQLFPQLLVQHWCRNMFALKIDASACYDCRHVQEVSARVWRGLLLLSTHWTKKSEHVTSNLTVVYQYQSSSQLLASYSSSQFLTPDTVDLFMKTPNKRTNIRAAYVLESLHFRSDSVFLIKFFQGLHSATLFLKLLDSLVRHKPHVYCTQNEFNSNYCGKCSSKLVVDQDLFRSPNDEGVERKFETATHLVGEPNDDGNEPRNFQ